MGNPGRGWEWRTCAFGNVYFGRHFYWKCLLYRWVWNKPFTHTRWWFLKGWRVLQRWSVSLNIHHIQAAEPSAFLLFRPVSHEAQTWRTELGERRLRMQKVHKHNRLTEHRVSTLEDTDVQGLSQNFGGSGGMPPHKKIVRILKVYAAIWSLNLLRIQ